MRSRPFELTGGSFPVDEGGEVKWGEIPVGTDDEMLIEHPYSTRLQNEDETFRENFIHLMILPVLSRGSS